MVPFYMLTICLRVYLKNRKDFCMKRVLLAGSNLDVLIQFSKSKLVVTVTILL